MSKKFRIAKRISMEDIDHFEDIEVDDDFVDKDMAQIIADNEYDPLYDDCENIAVALQLAGYGKMSDLEAKLAESEKERRKAYQDGFFQKQFEKDVEIVQLEQQLTESKKAIVNLTNVCDEWADKYIKLQNELAEKDQAIEGLQEINKSLGQTCNNDAKEIERLREELAEKEKEIEELKHFKVTIGTMNGQVDISSTTYTDQDKISFAVEQLEKVKKWVIEYSDLKGQNWDNTLRYLNNQIKQLKEGK